MPKENKKDDLEAVRILVEALTPFDNTERDRIIRWASEKLGISFETLEPRSSIVQPKSHELSGNITSEVVKKSWRDIKSFVDDKDPKNDQQLAAVVAYYYSFEVPEGQKKYSISSKDLVDACRLAQRKRPTNAGQTLINAAYYGYLDKAEEAGQYKLNAVGENLVAMTLPGGVPSKRPSQKLKQVKNKKVQKKVSHKNKKV